MEAGDYERAVSEYQQAVREAPRDREYQQKLDQAKQRRAELWLADANRLHREGDLNLSRTSCDAVLADFPNHIEAQPLRRRLQAEFDQATATLSRLKEELLQRRQPPQVVAGLIALWPLVRTFPELPAFRKRAEDMVQSDALTEAARQQSAQGQLEEALAGLTQALVLDPSNAAAATLQKQTQERLAATLSQQAELAERSGQHALAVSNLRRASTLVSWNAQQRASYTQSADGIIGALARRMQQAGQRSLQNRQPGLGWAQLKLASVLSPAQASPLPDLESALRYTVEVRSDGDQGSMQRLWPELERGLARYTSAGRVVLLGAGSGPAQALLRLSLRPLYLATRSGDVVQKVARYVKRIETRPNQDYLDLQGVVAEKGGRLRELDGVLSVEGERLRRLRHEQRRLREVYQQSSGELEAYRTSLRNAQDRLDDMNSQVRRAESKVSTAEYELKQTEYRGSTPQTPEQRRRTESEQQEAKHKLRRAELELSDVRRERDRLRRVVDDLSISQPSSSAANHAESVLGSKTQEVERQQSIVSDLEEKRQRVGSGLAHAEGNLARTSPTVDVPIRADHRYLERHALRLCRLFGEVTMQDLRFGRTVQLPVDQTKSADGFERDEQRAPGVPDLYIAPHRLQFPSDEELMGDVVAKTAKQLLADLDGPLGHHTDRFLIAASATQGAERLNLLVLAFHGQQQLTSAAEQIPKLVAEVRDSLGLDLNTSQVDLARLSGK